MLINKIINLKEKTAKQRDCVEKNDY